MSLAEDGPDDAHPIPHEEVGRRFEAEMKVPKGKEPNKLREGGVGNRQYMSLTPLARAGK